MYVPQYLTSKRYKGIEFCLDLFPILSFTYVLLKGTMCLLSLSHLEQLA